VLWATTFTGGHLLEGVSRCAFWLSADLAEGAGDADAWWATFYSPFIIRLFFSLTLPSQVEPGGLPVEGEEEDVLSSVCVWAGALP